MKIFKYITVALLELGIVLLYVCGFITIELLNWVPAVFFILGTAMSVMYIGHLNREAKKYCGETAQKAMEKPEQIYTDWDECYRIARYYTERENADNKIVKEDASYKPADSEITTASISLLILFFAIGR